MSREGKTTCFHSKKNWVLLSHVDARGKKVNKLLNSERYFLGFFIRALFSFIMTELKNEVVCTYKLLHSDLVSE